MDNKRGEKKLNQDDISVVQESSRDTGGWIWESARCLERTLLTQYVRDGWQNRKILELGSGTGWLALRLAYLGADVVATDQPSRLQLLRRNVLLTQAKFERYEQELNVRVCELEWGKQSQDSNVGCDFDMIIGSDLLYHAETHPALLSELKQRFLPHTIGVLAYEERNPEAEALFMATAEQSGLMVKVVDIQLVAHPLEDDFFAENTRGSEHKIVICQFTRKLPT